MSTDNVETNSDAPLSMSEAVNILTAPPPMPPSDEEQGDEDGAQEGYDAVDELPADEGGEDEGDDVETAEEPETDEEGDEDEEQPEGEQGDVGDDARVRLEDGSFVTVAELKAGALRRDDYTRKTQETAAERQATLAERETLTQLRQSNEQVRDYTISVLEQFMPQQPDEALYSTDPVRAMQMDRAFKARMEQLDYLKAQRDWDQQQQAQQRSEQAREQTNAEWAKLMAHPAMSELKDETRGKALLTNILSYGQKQGYSEQELRGALAFDHRQAVILRKAMAFDALQESKAKLPKRIEGRPPVQKSSKRLNPNGTAHREAKTAMNRLSQTGSLKDGISAYLALQKSKG